jgi:hypothetical protein
LPPTYYSVMSQNDDKLRALLRQWRDIEPRGNFEANVWRRIRTAAAEDAPERVTLVEAIGRLLWRPAWSVAAAVAMALVVGVWTGIATGPRRDTSRAELKFLAPGTLAGSYMEMGSKESR